RMAAGVALAPLGAKAREIGGADGDVEGERQLGGAARPAGATVEVVGLGSGGAAGHERVLNTPLGARFGRGASVTSICGISALRLTRPRGVGDPCPRAQGEPHEAVD